MNTETITMNATNQRIAAQLVEREVHYCVSSLVSRLSELEPDNEDLLDLSQSPPDYAEAVSENAKGIDWRDVADYLGIDYEVAKLAADASRSGDEDEEQTGKNVSAAIESAAKERSDIWEQVCDYERINADDHRREVFEHWLVSDWFAEKLRARGEVVCDDLHGLTVWGRTTTGQSIYMDLVIYEIASEMEILEGQANDWGKR